MTASAVSLSGFPPGIRSHRGRRHSADSRGYGTLRPMELSADDNPSPEERARLVLELSQRESARASLCCRVCDYSSLRYFVMSTRHAMDPVVLRSMGMVANVLVSLVFMVATVETAWDDTIADYSERAPTAELFKIVILVLTLVLEVQLVEYYIFVHRSKQRRRQETEELLRRSAEGESAAGNLSVPSVAALRPLSWPTLALEMLICAIIPLPDGALGLTERAGLFMFVRLYQIIRLLHKTSPIYLLRDRVARCRPFVGPAAARSLESVRYDVLLSIKAIFDAQPTFFLACLLFLTYFPISFSIYVQERDIQPENFDLRGSLWFTAVSMTTVGYGKIEPRDPWGQFLAMVACCVGVCLLSLTVIVLTRNLQFSDSEAVAWEVAQRLRLGDDETSAANATEEALGEDQESKKDQVSVVTGSPLDLPTRLLLIRLSLAVELLSRNQNLLMEGIQAQKI